MIIRCIDSLLKRDKYKDEFHRDVKRSGTISIIKEITRSSSEQKLEKEEQKV
jgi:hypothetical protein